MQFVYYQSHSYPKTAECSGRPGFAKDDMASKKYRINQSIDLAQLASEQQRQPKQQNPNPNTGRFTWALTIHIDENNVEGDPVVSCSGKANSEEGARKLISQFTKLALHQYSLLGHSAYGDDDDDD